MLGLCWVYAGFVLGLCWVRAGFVLQIGCNLQHKPSTNPALRHLHLYHDIRRGSLPLSTSAYLNHERPTPSSATAMAMGVACQWEPPPLPGDAIILRSAAANRHSHLRRQSQRFSTLGTSIIYNTIKGRGADALQTSRHSVWRGVAQNPVDFLVLTRRRPPIPHRASIIV